MTLSDQDVAQITNMGFSVEQAREALTVSNGNMEAAVNYILGGGGGPPPSTVIAAAAEPPPRAAAVSAKAGGVLRCSRSQYSVDQGRSACTCIALTAATNFLKEPNVTTEFLEEMITQGVANYQQLMQQQSSASTNNIEHLSAEEVLQKDSSRTIFPLQCLPGGIRQGLLSNDFHHPMGLKAILEGIREEQPRDEWMAVLITKTPETVLVCFPPASPSGPAAASAYWLIDSHPRPQLGVDSAFAKMHSSLDSLWMSLQAIFPCTDLGPDIPEMMAMMYNSFDLYPLLLSTSIDR
jgi:hypothetical protein